MTMTRSARASIAVLALFTLLAAVAPPAGSEEPQFVAGKRPMSLRECVQITLRSNPGLMAAGEQRDAARGRTQQARAPLLPQVNGSGSASISQSPERQSLIGGDLRSSPKNRYQQAGVGVSVEQSIIDVSSWKSAAGARASQASVDASFRTSQEAIVLAVERTYYNYLKTIHLLQVAEENLKVGEQQLKLAEKRREVGIGVEADILKARAQRAQNELAVINAEKEVHVAQATLSHLMGIPLDSPIVVEDIPPDEAAAPAPQADVEAALAARPEIVDQRHRVRAAEFSLGAAKARRIPTLGFQFGYDYLLDGRNKTFDQILGSDSRSRISDFDSADGSFVLETFPTRLDTLDIVTDSDPYGSWRASLALSLPIFTGGSTRGRINEARALAFAERANLAQLERDARLETQTSTLNVAAAARAIEVSRDGVLAAEEDLRVTQGSYTQGLLPILNLVQAQAALVDSRNAFVSATYDYRIALAELDRALGKGVAKYAE